MPRFLIKNTKTLTSSYYHPKTLRNWRRKCLMLETVEMLSDDSEEDAVTLVPVVVVACIERKFSECAPTRVLVEVAARVEIALEPGGITLIVVSLLCRPAVSVSIVTVEVPPVTLFICVV